MNTLKSQVLSIDAPSVSAVPQRSYLCSVPWDVKLEIYRKLKGSDLINFHLAFPKSTSELAPFYYLNSNFGYKDYALWPSIHLNRVPSPIEEDLIHDACNNLTLRLMANSLKVFNGISDLLRYKVTVLLMDGDMWSGRFHLNFNSLVIYNIILVFIINN